MTNETNNSGGTAGVFASVPPPIGEMDMKFALPAALAATVALIAAAPAATPKVPATIAAAVADPNRPAEDTARDANRKPAEMLEFAGVTPGKTVVDIMPGKGYFTRLFAKAVGA